MSVYEGEGVGGECDEPIVFAVAAARLNRLRETGERFYCPSGHGNSYGNSLAKKLEETERQLRAEKCETFRQRQAREVVEIELQRTICQKERLRKRVQNGVCPCCNRTFQNLARHMAIKHPEKKP